MSEIKLLKQKIQQIEKDDDFKHGKFKLFKRRLDNAYLTTSKQKIRDVIDDYENKRYKYNIVTERRISKHGIAYELDNITSKYKPVLTIKDQQEIRNMAKKKNAESKIWVDKRQPIERRKYDILGNRIPTDPTEPEYSANGMRVLRQ